MKIIYKITNIINNKVYIGQTNNWKKRWSTHVNDKQNGCLITRAIKKYGKENFEVKFLFENLSDDEANRLEKETIIKFNSKAPNGYNIREGGHDSKHSEDSKIKMSLAKKGIPTPRQLGKLHFNSLNIYQFDLNGKYINTFGSSYEAQRETGINQSHICKCCNEEIYSTGKFLWIYEKDFSEDLLIKKIVLFQKRKNYCKKPIENIITKKQYDSINELAKELNVSVQAVSNHLSGKTKTVGKQKFKFI